MTQMVKPNNLEALSAILSNIKKGMINVIKNDTRGEPVQKNTNKQTHEIRKTMKEEIDKRKYKKTSS
jgi:2-polyprenyl-3-methyl-5-hydroxy-6-metoxy-1,4-benzoquinol methylase